MTERSEKVFKLCVFRCYCRAAQGEDDGSGGGRSGSSISKRTLNFNFLNRSRRQTPTTKTRRKILRTYFLIVETNECVMSNASENFVALDRTRHFSRKIVRLPSPKPSFNLPLCLTFVFSLLVRFCGKLGIWPVIITSVSFVGGSSAGRLSRHYHLFVLRKDLYSEITVFFDKKSCVSHNEKLKVASPSKTEFAFLLRKTCL